MYTIGQSQSERPKKHVYVIFLYGYTNSLFQLIELQQFPTEIQRERKNTSGPKYRKDQIVVKLKKMQDMQRQLRGAHGRGVWRATKAYVVLFVHSTTLFHYSVSLVVIVIVCLNRLFGLLFGLMLSLYFVDSVELQREQIRNAIETRDQAETELTPLVSTKRSTARPAKPAKSSKASAWLLGLPFFARWSSYALAAYQKRSVRYRRYQM